MSWNRPSFCADTWEERCQKKAALQKKNKSLELGSILSLLYIFLIYLFFHNSLYKYNVLWSYVPPPFSSYPLFSPPPIMEHGQAWSCAGLTQVTTQMWACVCNSHVTSRRRCFTVLSPILRLWHSLFCLFDDVLWLWGDHVTTVRLKLSTCHFSRHCDKSWVAAFTTAPCRERLLQ